MTALLGPARAEWALPCKCRAGVPVAAYKRISRCAAAHAGARARPCDSDHVPRNSAFRSYHSNFDMELLPCCSSGRVAGTRPHGSPVHLCRPAHQAAVWTHRQRAASASSRTLIKPSAQRPCTPQGGAARPDDAGFAGAHAGGRHAAPAAVRQERAAAGGAAPGPGGRAHRAGRHRGGARLGCGRAPAAAPVTVSAVAARRWVLLRALLAEQLIL